MKGGVEESRQRDARVPSASDGCCNRHSEARTDAGPPIGMPVICFPRGGFENVHTKSKEVLHHVTGI
jgi:hypothetical protein